MMPRPPVQDVYNIVFGTQQPILLHCREHRRRAMGAALQGELTVEDEGVNGQPPRIKPLHAPLPSSMADATLLGQPDRPRSSGCGRGRASPGAIVGKRDITIAGKRDLVGNKLDASTGPASAAEIDRAARKV